MYFKSDQIDPVACYQLLVGAIVPRPIAWVSTKSASGIANLAPYSFFSVASCNPPVLSVTQVLPRDLQDKDTLRNLRETGECVVNVVDYETVEQMNASCANYPANVDEFTAVGIETTASESVNIAGVANAKVRYECKLREIVTISDQPMGGSMMLLDVVGIYVDDQYVKGTKINSVALNAVGKMGGDDYTKTTETFALSRPVV